MAASKKNNKTINRADEITEVAKVTEEPFDVRIAKVARDVEANLDTSKGSVTDYIRLMQMLRDCKEESTREVSVRWIELTEVK